MLAPERIGRLFLAVALIGFGVENIAFGHYVVARAAPWPADPLQQQLTAYVTGVLFVAWGAAILAQRWVREAALQAAFLILAWSLCLHWPKALAGPPYSGDWTNALKAVTLAAGGVLVGAAAAGPPSALLAALRAIAPHAAAPFFLLAGVQHILFVGFVQTLVPPFIPGAVFWTYVAAAALLAAGFGLLTPPVRRLAAICTGWMVFSWVFLVHVPLIFRINALEWQGVFEALGISGVCFLVAASASPAKATGCQLAIWHNMGSHMKTTIDIADALLDDARRTAERRGVTLRTLVEEGLRMVVKAERQRPAFRLRDGSFGGTGIAPDFEEGGWERVRDAIYSGHGA
jgi:uncharacterized membrane protein